MGPSVDGAYEHAMCKPPSVSTFSSGERPGTKIGEEAKLNARGVVRVTTIGVALG